MTQIGREYPAIRVREPQVAPIILPQTQPETAPEHVEVKERELVPAHVSQWGGVYSSSIPSERIWGRA